MSECVLVAGETEREGGCMETQSVMLRGSENTCTNGYTLSTSTKRSNKTKQLPRSKQNTLAHYIAIIHAPENTASE